MKKENVLSEITPDPADLLPKPTLLNRYTVPKNSTTELLWARRRALLYATIGAGIAFLLVSKVPSTFGEQQHGPRFQDPTEQAFYNRFGDCLRRSEYNITGGAKFMTRHNFVMITPKPNTQTIMELKLTTANQAFRPVDSDDVAILDENHCAHGEPVLGPFPKLKPSAPPEGSMPPDTRAPQPATPGIPIIPIPHQMDDSTQRLV